LSRPQYLREEKEIDILRKYTERIEFFSRIKAQQGAETHAELCRNLEYETLEKGKVLFEEGSLLI